MNISSLIVKNENVIVIKGVGNQIRGMDSEGYEISVLGISYPFYQEEFPHQVEYYKNMFKEE